MLVLVAPSDYKTYRRLLFPSSSNLITMRFITAVLALASTALAFTVTKPDNATGFVNDGQNLVSWTRVDTDPSNFTIVLVNKVCRLFS